jgi:hypothetical protein
VYKRPRFLEVCRFQASYPISVKLVRMLSSLLALGTMVATAIAAPSSSYVQHEKREALPPGWERTQKLPGHEVLPMRIALSQSNLDKADEFLMDVSHPDSPNFGYVATDVTPNVARFCSPESVSFSTFCSSMPHLRRILA